MNTQPRALTIMDYLSVALLVLASGLVFLYAPIEAVMGPVQKVFYFHVASAWVGMLSFAVAAVAGIVYLRTGNRQWDIIEFSAVEIGMAFGIIAVISGSIWARPIWNTWWTWDPRLTTTTIMILVYAAYLMLRNGIEDPDRRGRFGAVYAIVGFISVPLTFFSIRVFRTIHPVVFGGSAADSLGKFDMTPRMLQTFIFGLLVFTLIFADLLWHRVRMGKLADRVEQLKLKLLNQ